MQELQKIVRDLFLLINESNADKASQETVVKSGNKECFLCHSDNIFVFIAFNEMDENHDGKVSQCEFVEVTGESLSGIFTGMCYRHAWLRRSSPQC